MLIANTKPKTNIENSGYYRLSGNKAIATLLRNCHATVIKNGNQLEDLVYECVTLAKTKKHAFTGVEYPDANSIMVVSQFEIKKEAISLDKGVNVDYVYFHKDKVFVCEIKDGDNFDTKKSSGEVDKLLIAAAALEVKDPHKREYIPKIVLWNCKDLSKSSFKDKRGRGMLITGREFAQMINVDYEALNAKRKAEAPANTKYIIAEMKKITEAYETIL